MSVIVKWAKNISPSIPTWNGDCGFKHDITIDYDPKSPVQFRLHTINMNEGIGTHIDAPAHCFKNATAIDQLPLNNLLAPCIVIGVASMAALIFKLSC
jgi:kynurenine formamidase